MSTFYLAVDGDGIGLYLEYLAVTDQLDRLEEFSTGFEGAMKWLVQELQARFEARIVFTGGDNLLAIFRHSGQPADSLKVLGQTFQERSGSTLSMGVGYTSRQAYLALKLAKALGKNRLELFQGGING